MAITFALFSTVLFVAIGGGIDLSRAYNASQELTDVANLGCQYANRPSIVQNASVSGGGPAYVSSVTNFINASLHSQNFPFTQTNSTPFSYVQNGAANVSLTATVPTVFASIINITTIPISATAHCYDTPSSVPQIIPNGNSTLLAQEGFENTSVCPSGYCYVSPAGTVTHNGSTTGLIIDTQHQLPVFRRLYRQDGTGLVHHGLLRGNRPCWRNHGHGSEGNFAAELDCENGSHNAGNSSISTNIYLPAGSYELRYNYESRVDYPDYDPAYLCGTTASDLSWANDTNSLYTGGPQCAAEQSDQRLSGCQHHGVGATPYDDMIGTQKLAGSNLIDMCVYAQNWVERSVRINVTTAGYYWLSFAADGQNDSYGGQIDNIRLCNGTCAGSVQDNFPSAWTTSPTLFEDTFESPSYSNGSAYNTNGNMGNSLGTSGASSGWPGQTASGWANAPINQLPYWLQSCPQGSQCVELGWGSSSGPNSLISRGFLLDPGYYKVSYDYVSEVTFSDLSGAYCGVNPSAANIPTLSYPEPEPESIAFSASTTER